MDTNIRIWILTYTDRYQYTHMDTNIHIWIPIYTDGYQ